MPLPPFAGNGLSTARDCVPRPLRYLVTGAVTSCKRLLSAEPVLKSRSNCPPVHGLRNAPLAVELHDNRQSEKGSTHEHSQHSDLFDGLRSIFRHERARSVERGQYACGRGRPYDAGRIGVSSCRRAADIQPGRRERPAFLIGSRAYAAAAVLSPISDGGLHAAGAQTKQGRGSDDPRPFCFFGGGAFQAQAQAARGALCTTSCCTIRR